MFSIIRKLFAKSKPLDDKQTQRPVTQRRKKKPYWGVVVAKRLFPKEWGFMYESSKLIPGQCSYCHNTLEKIPNVNFVIIKKKGCIYSTYDGFIVVNQKFKIFCETQKYANLTFIPLVKSEGWYFFMPNEIFQVDEKRTIIRHANYNHGKYKRKGIMEGDEPCPHCGQYDWTGDGSFTYSKTRLSDSEDFIMRLPEFHGDFNHKFPIIIVGKRTAELLNNNGLATGVDFDDVYYWDR